MALSGGMDPLSARVTARWRWLNGLAIDMLTFSTSSGTSSFNSASLPGSDPAIQNVGLQEYPMFQTASGWIAGSAPGNDGRKGWEINAMVMKPNGN